MISKLSDSKKMNKKAQLQQVFTYIMTGIVIIAVLTFGISLECEDYDTLWFIDLDKCGDGNFPAGITDPIVRNSCEDGVKQNVFMGKNGDVVEDFFYIEGLKVSGDVLNFDLASGRTIHIKLQGTGSGMILSRQK